MQNKLTTSKSWRTNVHFYVNNQNAVPDNCYEQEPARTKKKKKKR